MSDLFDWIENKSGKPGDEIEKLAVLFERSRVNLPDAPPLEVGWADLRNRMAAADLAAPPSRPFWARLVGWPALTVLAMAVLLFVWLRPAADVTLTVERGQRFSAFVLKDQSTVTVKSDSNLKLDSDFNRGNRLVTLEGEAYFEIEKGKAPFVIKAGSSRIEVVGTKFFVYARDGVVRLDVTEGIVAFSNQAGGAQRVHAGESSAIVGDDLPQAPKPNGLKDKAPEWMRDRFTFDDVPLEEICKALERRFDITIKIDDPKLRSLALKGTLATESLDDTMKALVAMAECHFHRDETGAYVLK